MVDVEPPPSLARGSLEALDDVEEVEGRTGCGGDRLWNGRENCAVHVSVGSRGNKQIEDHLWEGSSP